MGAPKVQRTHCYRGHEFTPENTITNADPRSPLGYRRQCRACKAISDKARYAKPGGPKVVPYREPDYA